MAYDAPTFYAVDSTLSLLAFAAVCLRFWVRLRVQPTYLGADDWLILGAFVFFLADAANQIVGKCKLHMTLFVKNHGLIFCLRQPSP